MVWRDRSKGSKDVLDFRHFLDKTSSHWLYIKNFEGPRKRHLRAGTREGSGYESSRLIVGNMVGMLKVFTMLGSCKLGKE